MAIVSGLIPSGGAGGGSFHTFSEVELSAVNIEFVNVVRACRRGVVHALWLVTCGMREN